MSAVLLAAPQNGTPERVPGGGVSDNNKKR
jgi:hypothetical protein